MRRRNSGPLFQFYVTGNDRNLASEIRAGKPANVTFTGFLSESQYWSVLRNANLVVDLTMVDNCLKCGAYEALAVGTPLVLSSNAAWIEWFGGAARFAGNSANAMAQAIRKAKVSATQTAGTGEFCA